MRKPQNMLLRGSTWNLRVAVPVQLQTLRRGLGIRSSREVWRTLGTGDLRAAKLRAAQVKADVYREFESEVHRYRNQPVPSVDEIEAVARDFHCLVEASLTNERLLELPTAVEVEQAQTHREQVDQALGMVKEPSEVERLTIQYFAHADITFAAEDMREARQKLLSALRGDLAVNDFRAVEPYILQAARARSYRIEASSSAYRLMGHRLLKVWIQALANADDHFLATEVCLADQEAALAAWAAPAVGKAIKAVVAETPHQLTEPLAPERDIRKLFEMYLSERFPKLAANAAFDRRRTIAQFIEVAGHKDVVEYRKTDVTAYKTALTGLPAHAGRKYPGKTMAEVRRLAPNGSPVLAPKTIKSRLSILGSFGRWLSENIDGVDSGNFRTTAPQAKRPQYVVKEFSDAEVRAIVHARAFTGCLSEKNQTVPGIHKLRDYRYWIPLLAAFTGCRLNELTQLLVDDVVTIGGVWALNITDQADNQSLKTKASARLVPVHEALVQAGFLDFVQRARDNGRVALFSEIPIGRDGRRSEAAGKWFRKFLVRIGVKDSGSRGGIHRFRHCVVQKLRDAGYGDVEIALVVGHSAPQTMVTAGYGSSRAGLLQHQQRILAALQYDGLSVPV